MNGKILHIVRTKQDELVRKLIAALDSNGRVVTLEGGPVDYDRLVADIFASEKVICWW
jgi:hypothetical protein